MGKPAARLGDMTAHGGSIVVGFPTVLIGGMPAARVGDMHVCPLVNPGVPPPPHVGGPIAMGSPTVLIGGMPAARMGDMAPCAGPPDVIVLGCPTVLIGEAGAGGGGPSGMGMGTPASVAAQISAATAQKDNAETSTKWEHWIEFEFVDKAGKHVSGIPYKFTDPDGNESEAVLRLDGTIRRDGISQGQAKAVLMSVSNAKWSKEKAEVGEKIGISAETVGFDDDTPAIVEIIKRDVKGPDVVVDTIETRVKGGKIESEWEFFYPEAESKDVGAAGAMSYSSPEFYFRIVLGLCKGYSDLLLLKDDFEIELKNENDNPVADEDYILFLPDGSVRQGKLDGNGYVKEEKVPPGRCQVVFPNLENAVLDKEEKN
jgi:uncharacterized Zn-binding protein involved in type VI secretion